MSFLDSSKSRSILFSAWRIHSNQTGWLQALKNKGYKVTYHVQNLGWTENHDVIKPCILRPSVLCQLPWFRNAFKNEKPIWGRRRRIIPSIRETYNQLRASAPDVIVIRETSARLLVTMILGIFWTRRFVLYTQQPLYSERKPNWKVRIKRKFLNILFTSCITPVRGKGKWKFSESALFVPFAVNNANSNESRTYMKKGVITVLSIGKLFVARKNHFFIIKVIRDLLAQGHKIQLTLLGALNRTDDPYFLRLVQYIKSNGLSSSVKILANVPYKECQQYFNQANVYVLVSDDEPAAVSHLEAMAAGAAIICSTSNGTYDYVVHNYNGFHVRPGKISKLNHFLELLITDSKMLSNMGTASLELVNEYYSPSAVLPLLEQAFFKNY
jgi:glycosyltransferase involved in cell wall biosynthesis